MENVSRIHLNFKSNKITSTGILSFIHAFDNLTNLNNLYINLNNNEFSNIAFELLFEYLRDKSDIQIIIVLAGFESKSRITTNNI